MSTFRYTPISLAIISLFSSSVFAEDTATEETGDRMNIMIVKGITNIINDEDSRTETGTAITIITEKDIEQQQATTVADILKNSPGVTIASNGGLGKKTSVFMRGAASESVVVVIDGVRVTDQSSASGGFDFANLMADGIERIEVIRGSQSALWGSDALGGVINIITKEGGNGFNATGTAELGANNYAKQFININGGDEKAHYSLSVANLTTEGISAGTGSDDDPDDDGYRNTMVNFKAGYRFNDIFAIDGVARYTDAKSEYDAYGYTAGADNDVYSLDEQRTAKINLYVNLLDSRWNNRLSLSYADTTSENFDPNGWNGDYTENSGETIKAEVQSDYLLSTDNIEQRFTFAGEIQKDTFLPWNSGSTPDEQKMNSAAIIGEYHLNWHEKVFFTGSLRHDFNTEFDDTNTYKLALSAWAADSIRLHTSYGTGVKNPTFSQLFGTYATPNLESETSISADMGIEYNFANQRGYIDITYFDAEYENGIRWNQTLNTGYGAYENQDENVQGIELSSTFNVNEDYTISGQYTYLMTEDGTVDKKELIRRPKHSATLNNNYQINSKLNTNLGINYVGERYDYGYVPLDDYTLVNLGASYQLTDHFSIHGRVENVLDKDYVVITDYGVDPFSAYIGVTFK